MSDAPMEGAPAAAGGNVLEELVDILVAPARTFAALRTRGAWPHVIILSLLTLAVVIALRGLLEPFLEANMAVAMRQAAAKGQAVPPGAARAMGSFAWWGFVVTSAFTVGLTALFGGAALWAAGLLLKVALPFQRAVVIGAVAAVTVPFSMLAMGVQGAFLDPAAIRGLTDASLGPARFFDPATTAPALLAMVSRIDLLGLWGVALQAIGVGGVAGVPRKTGWAVAGLAWALSTIVSSIPAVLF
jgi:hypothetical protein